jgi:hypothetical protein
MSSNPYTLERVTPAEVLILAGVGGRLEPVTRAVAHPPGSHAASPIVDDLTAVELVTAAGSRWFGTSRAWIGSDLRMHVMVNPRDEVRAGWDAGDVDGPEWAPVAKPEVDDYSGFNRGGS